MQRSSIIFISLAACGTVGHSNALLGPSHNTAVTQLPRYGEQLVVKKVICDLKWARDWEQSLKVQGFVIGSATRTANEFQTPYGVRFMKADTQGDIVVADDPDRIDCQKIVLRLQRFEPGTQPAKWKTPFGLVKSRRAKARCLELAKQLDYQESCHAFEPYFPDDPAFPFDYEDPEDPEDTNR